MHFNPSGHSYGTPDDRDYSAQLMLTTYAPNLDVGAVSLSNPDAAGAAAGGGGGGGAGTGAAVAAGIGAATTLFGTIWGSHQSAKEREHQAAMSQQQLELATASSAAAAAEAAAKADVQKKLIVYGVGAFTLLGVMGVGAYVWTRSR